jgi:hypothetical protein
VREEECRMGRVRAVGTAEAGREDGDVLLKQLGSPCRQVGSKGGGAGAAQGSGSLARRRVVGLAQRGMNVRMKDRATQAGLASWRRTGEGVTWAHAGPLRPRVQVGPAHRHGATRRGPRRETGGRGLRPRHRSHLAFGRVAESSTHRLTD